MATAPPLTKPSTPRLSDFARKVVVPSGVVSTSWPAVREKCADFGITFRPWQDGAGKLILAKRADGKYAATIGGTGLSIPRQVGKTFLVGAIVFALCMLRPNLTVIWTAHRLRTSEETFGKMQAFAKRRKVKPHILRIVLGSGEEAILFRNGSRILFGARATGFGLGFDEVDVLIFDEAQRLTDITLDDMIPAANQSRQDTGALLLFMGTPPRPTDPGEAFTRMRTEALSGEDEDTGWVEFGADPGFIPTPAPAPLTEADWAQVAKANPSFPEDTPREAILRMRKKLGPDSFLREGLGIWDDETRGNIFGSDWRACRIADADIVPEALGLAVSLDRDWASIACRATVDGFDHPVLGAVKREPGDEWVLAELVRIGLPVALDPKGPAGVLAEPLREAGVEVFESGMGGYLDACEDMRARVKRRTLGHMAHAEIEDALGAAAWRTVGDRLAFGRKSGEISMAEAAALALWCPAYSDPSVYVI